RLLLRVHARRCPPRTDTHLVVTDVSEEPRGQEYVALVIGVLVAVIILLVSAILLIVWRSRRQKSGTITHETFTTAYGDKRDIVNLKMGVEGAGGELDKNGLYSEPYHMTYSSMGGYSSLAHKIPHLNPLSSPDYTECPSTDYAIPHLDAVDPTSITTNTNNTNNTTNGPPPPTAVVYAPPPLPHTKPPHAAHHHHNTLNTFLSKASQQQQQQQQQESFYATTDLVQGGTGSSGGQPGGQVGGPQTQQTAGAAPPLEETRAREIPRLAITLLQQLGEGQFGEVHLGEVEDEDGEKQMVAVKTLRMEASHSVRWVCV
ncbi:hypothetical protein Pmani_035519, partial [Petrolisthes manimaculis]